MSRRKETRILHGTAGLNSSKGEHILKLLYELWQKIIDLQNARQAEKTTGADAGESVAEKQYKLLETQLDYIHRHLHNKMDGEPCNISEGKPNNGTSSSCNVLYADDELDMIPVKLEKETQTSKSPLSVTLPKEKETKTTCAVQTDSDSAKVTIDQRVQQDKCDGKQELNVNKPSETPDRNAEVSPNVCSHSHYHMKLSDVPFLVGKSTNASHSVIANVQNVIGLMKTHNKGLCSTSAESEKRKTCRKLSEPVRKPTSFQVHEMKVTLKHLAEELGNLAAKQEMLRQKLYSVQHIQKKDEVFEEYNGISQLLEIKAKEVANVHQKLKKDTSDIKEQKNLTKPVNRHVVYKAQHCGKNKVRSNKTVPRAPTNQRVMRSIKVLKGKLKNEEVGWC